MNPDPGPRPRGRPRAVDGDQVLAAVLGVFWEKGLSGASLDELAAAAGVSRPSLYAALGDKRAMYLAAVDRVGDVVAAEIAATFVADRPLAIALAGFFEAAITAYVAGAAPRGCLIMCTAPAEALSEPLVGNALARVIASIDAGFEQRYRLATSRGELDSARDPALLAQQTTAILQSLALRARAGTAESALRSLATASVGLLLAG